VEERDAVERADMAFVERQRPVDAHVERTSDRTRVSSSSAPAQMPRRRSVRALSPVIITIGNNGIYGTFCLAGVGGAADISVQKTDVLRGGR